MKLNCIVDSQSYKTKPPTTDMGFINNRIVNGIEQSLSVEELEDIIRQGRTYLAGHLIKKENGRKKDNIKNINFISLDVDNHYKNSNKEDIYTDYSTAEVIEALESLLDAKPFMYYQTFTGINKEKNSKRYRLLYPLDRSVSSREVELLLKFIVDNTSDMFDNACTDSSRMFLATNRDIETYRDYKAVDTSIIDRIKRDQEEHQRELERQREHRKAIRQSKGYDSTYSDDLIDELKQIDLSDYLINQGYSSIEKTSTGYKMPCPIHNGMNKGAFSISYKSNAWLWRCFSSSCGGGTIIDLHAQLNNLEVGQSIKELLEMYNIKPLERTFKASNTYSIEKYISNDKTATDGILKAIEDNKRILITAPMGSGKTHFTIKNIYSYAKAIGKVVIMIIPSVKQLENLNKNKDIPIVYEKMPVYMGTDIVATTPESLPKITSEVGTNKYILIADESHERYTSLYRTGYKEKNIEKAEEHAFKSIHLTATPRLLVNDDFERVINIESKTTIENKVTIFKIEDRLEDNMLSIVKKLVEADRQPILFNNNKEINKLLANDIEVKELITIAEYKQGQLDIFKADDPQYQTVEKTIISTETIQSGKKSENVAVGHIKADATFTTSSITAGVDLYTRENSTLVINTRGISFDNVIQLIGRFRKGIDVIILTPNNEEKKRYFELQQAIDLRVSDSVETARLFNNSKAMQRLSESKKGIKESAHLELDNNNRWVVNETKVIADVYKEWSEAVYDNVDVLIKLLRETTAFKVLDVKVAKFNDENERTMTDLKEATKEAKKEILRETSEKLLKLTDDELSQVIYKDYDRLDSKTVEVASMYHAVGERDIEKIHLTVDKLFTDNVGIEDVSSAFRKFYSQSWNSIKREIAEVEAREINKLIREHGTETYLQIKSAKHKRAIDVVQAKIRHELKDIEKKQGRLSDKRFTQLVRTLIDEHYIFNKLVKTYTDKDTTEKDKEKAFQSVGQDVGKLVRDIYNLTSDNRISSIKE